MEWGEDKRLHWQGRAVWHCGVCPWDWKRYQDGGRGGRLVSRESVIGTTGVHMRLGAVAGVSKGAKSMLWYRVCTRDWRLEQEWEGGSIRFYGPRSLSQASPLTFFHCSQVDNLEFTKTVPRQHLLRFQPLSRHCTTIKGGMAENKKKVLKNKKKTVLWSLKDW